MRNELLKHDDYNVIIVDWAGGSLPLYTQATANTRLVGLEIAHLVKHLQVNGNFDFVCSLQHAMAIANEQPISLLKFIGELLGSLDLFLNSVGTSIVDD